MKYYSKKVSANLKLVIEKLVDNKISFLVESRRKLVAEWEITVPIEHRKILNFVTNNEKSE